MEPWRVQLLVGDLVEASGEPGRRPLWYRLAVSLGEQNVRRILAELRAEQVSHRGRFIVARARTLAEQQGIELGLKPRRASGVRRRAASAR